MQVPVVSQIGSNILEYSLIVQTGMWHKHTLSIPAVYLIFFVGMVVSAIAKIVGVVSQKWAWFKIIVHITLCTLSWALLS